jgi:methylated-DNA-[protein]-cysteine S-methyltransferase
MMTSQLATIYYDSLSTSLGELVFTSDGEFLTGLSMNTVPPKNGIQDPKTLNQSVSQVRAYLAGELKEFDLSFQQTGTPFQIQVWAELVKIPYGTTISYAELAKRINRPGASRAVGSANGRNSIGIIVPCHRVIAADGKLGGYDWGLDRKKWLLNHEQEQN